MVSLCGATPSKRRMKVLDVRDVTGLENVFLGQDNIDVWQVEGWPMLSWLQTAFSFNVTLLVNVTGCDTHVANKCFVTAYIVKVWWTCDCTVYSICVWQFVTPRAILHTLSYNTPFLPLCHWGIRSPPQSPFTTYHPQTIPPHCTHETLSLSPSPLHTLVSSNDHNVYSQISSPITESFERFHVQILSSPPHPYSPSFPYRMHRPVYRMYLRSSII